MWCAMRTLQNFWREIMIFLYKYKWIFILLIGLPFYSSIFSEFYTFYYTPVIKKNNAMAKVDIFISSRGVKENLYINFSFDNKVVTFWANDLDENMKSIYKEQVNKKAEPVVLGYKINPCVYCLYAKKSIPIYFYGREEFSLNEKNSKVIFIKEMYGKLIFFAWVLIVFLFVIYRAAKYPRFK
jgi:hypothetical protein